MKTIRIVIQARTISVIEKVLIRNSIKKNIPKMIIHPVKRNIGIGNDDPGHVLTRHIKETVEANPLIDRSLYLDATLLRVVWQLCDTNEIRK